MGSVLKVVGIDKSFKKEAVLQQVSFEIRAHEIVGIIGENGSGKTTLFSIISGFVQPDKGEVMVCGLENRPAKERLYHHLAFTADHADFYPNMTARENLRMYITDQERIHALLELVGLQDENKKVVKNYSLGMRQRLNIARALATKPSLMLMDEIFNGLDAGISLSIQNYLTEYVRRNEAAILVSSHALKEVGAFCTRFIFMRNGTVGGDVTVQDRDISAMNAFMPVDDFYESIYKNAPLDEKSYLVVSEINRAYFNRSAMQGDCSRMTELKSNESVIENIYISFAADGGKQLCF